MSAIATVNSSATSAVASLLSDTASAAPVGGAVAATATNSNQAASSASSNPVDIVDLSDRAKATLARTRTEQAAADKLSALVQSVRDQNGKSGSVSNSTAGDTSKIFDALKGGSQSRPTDVSSLDPNKDRDAYLDALKEANRQPDGTVASFSKTVSDAFNVPSTPQEVDSWYNTYGQTLIAGAQFFPDEAATGIAQAVQDRSITILNAKDIPDLNLHNTLTFAGGENGRSLNGTATWNHDAAIFKDTTTNYRVFGDGYVIAWKKPEGDATLGVVPATGPITLNLPSRQN